MTVWGNKEIYWINAARAIGIIAVYWIHSQKYYGLYMEESNFFIKTFYVNVFFIISGFLLFRKQLDPKILNSENNYRLFLRGSGKRIISNIFFRLVIPSFFFSVLVFIPKCFIGLNYNALSLSEFLNDTILGGTYWFVSALVVSEALFFFLFLSRSGILFLYCLVGCVIMLFGIYIEGYEGTNIWCYKQGLIACGFIVVGALLNKLDDFLDNNLTWYIICLSIFSLLLVSFCGDKINAVVSSLKFNIGGFCLGSTVSLLVICLSKYLPFNKYLEFVGKNTISFYFLSGALPMLFSIILKKILGVHLIVPLIMVFGFSFVLAGIITYYLIRFVPCVFDLRKVLNKCN
jgi:peptidoglycan/LPS O-acetylase OafA/YrhL